MFDVKEMLADESGDVLLQASFRSNLDNYNKKLSDNFDVNPRELFGAFGLVQTWPSLFDSELPAEYKGLSERVYNDIQRLVTAYRVSISSAHEYVSSPIALRMPLYTAARCGKLEMVQALLVKAEVFTEPAVRIQLMAVAYDACLDTDVEIIQLLETDLNRELDSLMYPNGRPVAMIDSLSSSATRSQEGKPLGRHAWSADLMQRIKLLMEAVEASLILAGNAVAAELALMGDPAGDSHVTETDTIAAQPERSERAIHNIEELCKWALRALEKQHAARVVMQQLDVAMAQGSGSGTQSVPGSNTSTESFVTQVVNRVLHMQAAEVVPVVPEVPEVVRPTDELSTPMQMLSFSERAVSPMPGAQQTALESDKTVLDENYHPEKKSKIE